jgi:hypothetical protein
MSTKILEKIKKKEEKRQALLSQLLKEKKMVRGSFCQIFVKCGKSPCWCINEKGHPHKRMSWHYKGKSYSRAVPKEDHQWIEEMTNNFREHRKMRKEIAKLENEIQKNLDQLEEYEIRKSIKGKKYLRVGITDFGSQK